MIRQLEQVRSRARFLLIAQRGARLLGATLLAVLVLVLLDYVFRFPALLRAVLLSAGLATLFVAFIRWAVPALWFRPSLTQIALRTEAMQPQLGGRLASSIDFLLSGAATNNALAGRAVRETARRMDGADMGSVVRYRPAMAEVLLMVFAAVLVITMTVGSPALASIGAQRLLLPFSSAAWPARTSVESLMDDVLRAGHVHPRGQVLPLRARNTTEGSETERVEAQYRVVREGTAGAWQRAILTHQGDGIHERLLDVDGEEIELLFNTEDAQTVPERIRLEYPPLVLRARVMTQPPLYARGFVSPREAELGPGTDGRARLRDPLVAGSHVRLELIFNKPLPLPTGEIPRRERLAAMLDLATEGAAERVIEEAGTAEIDRLTIVMRTNGPLRQRVTLEDAFGLTNPDPIEFVLDAAADLPPAVTLLEPTRDQTVLAGARIDIAAEATDDVAVRSIGLSMRLQRSGSSEAVELEFPAEREVEAQTADIAAAAELGPFDLHPGDVLLLTAYATDGWVPDPDHETSEARPASVSTVRRLQVVSDLDMAAQMRRQLGSIRQNAIRIESLQSELQDRMRATDDVPVASVDAAAVASAQAQLVERIAAQREAVDDLLAQAARNRMEDEQMDELLQQSRDLLDFAGRAASEAAAAAEGVARQGEPAGEDDVRPVVERQREVREELTDLVALLDRDEDAWLVQRQIEQLLERQQAITDATAAAESRTIGIDQADLEAGEREELERLSQEQRALRDEVRRLNEEMQRRAAAMSDVDQEAGEAMRRAARTAEQRELDRAMERAAERIEENQLSNAAASQEDARQTMERMLQELADTGRNRAEELLRRLASLGEVIDRLILAQENELVALAQAEETGDYSGRDRAMIRLIQNTRSATDEARATQQTRRIARRLQQAADVQGEAVAALRAAPLNAAAAREAEERSLQLLQEAKALAEELEAETEEDLARQQREALIAAYRALGERQVMIRMETQELTGVEESRRQLMEARRLAGEQDALRAALSDLAVETPDIMDSEVFGLVHELMDRWSSEVSESLRQGRARRRETDRQRLIAESIFRQIAAIEEASVPPPDFVDNEDEGAEGEGGQGGQGGEGGILPQAAEMQRLLGLQIQVRDETRRVHDDADASADERTDRARELGQLQREILRIAEGMAAALAPPQPVIGPVEEPE